MNNDAPKVVPTWGYHADGRSQIFQLEEGEDLPNGWSDAPIASDSSGDDSDDITDEELDELTAPEHDDVDDA
ncbi:MAG: hypothetical protein AAF497_10325 [Planctomycetota bacterium]